MLITFLTLLDPLLFFLPIYIIFGTCTLRMLSVSFRKFQISVSIGRSRLEVKERKQVKA